LRELESICGQSASTLLYQGSWAAWESELGGFAFMATYFFACSSKKVSKKMPPLSASSHQKAMRIP